MSYAQELRVVGQTIERLELRDFQITAEQSGYLVRSGPDDSPSHSRLTPQEIGRLERVGQSLRRESNQVPDFYRPSHLLRALGAYMDVGGLRLVQLSKHGPGITLETETAWGNRQVEERSIGALYDVSVRMYLKRSNRS